MGGGRRRIENLSLVLVPPGLQSFSQEQFLQESCIAILVCGSRHAHHEAPDVFNVRSASARRAITTSNSGGAAMNIGRICV